MKKTFVLDTNIPLNDSNVLNSFDENDVIIPLVVLEELDNHKNRQDEVGKNARAFSRQLDELRKLGSFQDGITLPGGGKVFVLATNSNTKLDIPGELDSSKVDNIIIAFAHQIGSKEGVNCVLISKDINVRLKCDALGVKCEDYLKMRVANDPEKFYRGVEVIEVDDQLIDFFYRHNQLDIPESVLEGRVLYPNQIVIVKNVVDGQTAKSAITKVQGPKKTLVPITKIDNAFGLKPRNKEQNFSFDLLFDDNVKLLTLSGVAGTGKTLITLAAGLAQLNGLGAPDVAKYNKLIVTRPIQPLGKDIGFLPGTLEEKMEPWVAPIRDNLNFLMGNKRPPRPKKADGTEARDRNQNSKLDTDNGYLALMQEKGLIEVEAITFIRGRSIPNAFIVIDEAQNLSMHELKTIITRVGEGTKIVLTGDIEQIDNSHVDVYTNGLTCAIERFKEYDIAAHVTLTKGERSALATLASKIL